MGVSRQCILVYVVRDNVFGVTICMPTEPIYVVREYVFGVTTYMAIRLIYVVRDNMSGGTIYMPMMHYLYSYIYPGAASNSSQTIRATHHVYYGVATISRLLKITGLFCRISSLL